MVLTPGLLQRLNIQYLALNEIIANVDAETINRNPEPGKWGIHDNIAHLASYQDVFIGRINLILQHNGITFEGYKGDDDPNFKASQQMTVSGLLSKIDADRKSMIDLIESIPAGKLNYTATHLRYGKMTLPEWIQFFLLHESHHLFIIFKLAH